MAKIDGGLRSLFKTHLVQYGFHCQAIETGGTGKGIPDFNYCVEGVEGWIEFKQTKAWAVSNMEIEQCAWITQRIRAGGRVYIGVRRKCSKGVRRKAVDELWLIDGLHADLIRDKGLKVLDSKFKIWNQGPKKWDWHHIANILLGHSIL